MTENKEKTPANLIEEFSSQFISIQQVVLSIPETKRTQNLLGEWSAKDVLAHLTGWARHDTACIKHLMEDRVAFYDENLERMNQTYINKRRKNKWGKVYQDFLTTTRELLETYMALPQGLWNTRIWPDKNLTPTIFIEESIEHWERHFHEIKETLCSK